MEVGSSLGILLADAKKMVTEFEVTHDISDITIIDMLSSVGKKTQTVARFSTVGGEKGSPDTARDPRGFSVKFYTDEGNWDWVYVCSSFVLPYLHHSYHTRNNANLNGQNNTPVFFLRDPTKFPLFIHVSFIFIMMHSNNSASRTKSTIHQNQVLT